MEALQRQASYFRDMDRQNNPAFDHKQGHFTDEYPDVDTSRSEGSLDAHLRENRELLGDQPEWRSYYRGLDRTDATELRHIRQSSEEQYLGR